MKLIFSFLLLTFSISTYAINDVINNETGLIGVITFDYDKSNLDSQDKTALLKLISDFSGNSIIINGFTDSDGNADYNKALSKRRAESVKQFLVKNGYPSSKITRINANGEIKEGIKALNRKVEVYLAPIAIRLEKNSPLNVPIDTIDIEESLPVIAIEQVNTNVSLNDQISTLEIGQTLAIKNLNFIPGRHFLLPNSEPVLNEILKILKDNPTLKIEIQGHICCMAQNLDGLDKDTQTMSLSVNRAKYIYNYLINHKVSPYRLSFKGFGASKPLVSEITEEDRAKNRRVEIMIVDK